MYWSSLKTKQVIENKFQKAISRNEFCKNELIFSDLLLSTKSRAPTLMIEHCDMSIKGHTR